MPPVQLLICGAGQDAIPLAQYAAQLGWQTLIADHREAFLTPERFPEPARLFTTRPEDLATQFTPDARTVAVIMTHHAGYDRDYLRVLLPSDTAYIGLLGPKRRGERLLNELRDTGFCPELEQLARLRSPAGLDIGAETPEEIAVSLIAEIQAGLVARVGRACMERNGKSDRRREEPREQASKTEAGCGRSTFRTPARRDEAVHKKDVGSQRFPTNGRRSQRPAALPRERQVDRRTKKNAASAMVATMALSGPGSGKSNPSVRSVVGAETVRGAGVVGAATLRRLGRAEQFPISSLREQDRRVRLLRRHVRHSLSIARGDM